MKLRQTQDMDCAVSTDAANTSVMMVARREQQGLVDVQWVPVSPCWETPLPSPCQEHPEAEVAGPELELEDDRRTALSSQVLPSLGVSDEAEVESGHETLRASGVRCDLGRHLRLS